MEYTLTNFENMTAEHLKEIAGAATGLSWNKAKFNNPASLTLNQSDGYNDTICCTCFILKENGSLLVSSECTQDNESYSNRVEINADAYIAKRNELGYKLEPKSDNAINPEFIVAVYHGIRDWIMHDNQENVH